MNILLTVFTLRKRQGCYDCLCLIVYWIYLIISYLYHLPSAAQRNQFMTPNGFTMYMLSKENCVFNPEHLRVYQDMNQPLSHYFISSSHNTYLTKDQLTGDSSTESYIRWAASCKTSPQLKGELKTWTMSLICSCSVSSMSHNPSCQVAEQFINDVGTWKNYSSEVLWEGIKNISER